MWAGDVSKYVVHAIACATWIQGPRDGVPPPCRLSLWEGGCWRPVAQLPSADEGPDELQSKLGVLGRTAPLVGARENAQPKAGCVSLPPHPRALSRSSSRRLCVGPL